MLLVSLLLACSSEVDDKPAAEVTTPAPAPTPAPPPEPDPAPAGEELKVKLDESSISFVGAKVTGDHDGGFEAFDGTLTVSEGEPVATSFTIDTTSTWADVEKLQKHLKSPDFFDVEQHAEARFVSSKIEEGDAGYTITGKLDFVGKQAEVRFPATIELGEGSAKASAAFTIDRTLWGVTYPGKPDDLIKDEVLIKLDLSFGS